MTEKEAEAIRTRIARPPVWQQQWQGEQARRPGLGHTLRREGRPGVNRSKAAWQTLAASY